MIDVLNGESRLVSLTSGELAREAENKMKDFHHRRESARKEFRANVGILIEEKGINLSSFNLSSEQREIFLDAIADAKAVEATERKKPTEEIREVKTVRGKILIDPLATRYGIWFRNAQIENPEPLLKVVSQVVPSVVVGNLSKS